LDQLWTYVTDNAEALGVVVATVGVIIAFLAWWWPKSTDPPPGRNETVHGPKVGGDVSGDAVGRDKTTVQGDQVGRDKRDDRFQGHNITAEQVIIQQSGEAAAQATVALGSRFQLPPRNPDFEGRKGKLAEIKTALRAGATQITALEGMGGIGKTDTAVQAAHDLVDEGRFKDAQLFLDLQGFSETGHPLAAADALRRLLRPFVSADETLPENEQELSRRFRDVTRDLDMLLFLDNAKDEEQVELLLPRHRTCAPLITSRNRLAVPGLKPIDLDEMLPDDAAALALKLANRRQANRITSSQAVEMVRLCGYLPISIEVTANALGKTKGADAASYLAKLGARTKPLKALEKAKAVLRLSIEALNAEARARWSALGAFEGSFVEPSAAAVWSVEDATAQLEELEQRSLVSFDPETKRYHLHDLLRAVAHEELARDLSRQHEVLRRHAEHFFATLQAAHALYSTGHDNVARGLALLDTELSNIRAGQRWAAAAMAAQESAAEIAQRFPHEILLLRLTPDEMVAWLDTALAAAEKRGDRHGQALVAGNLGLIYGNKGQFDHAEEMHLRALAIYKELRDELGVASQYGNLGAVYHRQNELDRAENMHKKSLAIVKTLDDKRGMAAQYSGLGVIYMYKGEFDCAEEMLKRSLELEMELGHKQGVAVDYANLGFLCARRNDVRKAVTYWRKSLVLYREIGSLSGIQLISDCLRIRGGVDPDPGDAAE
jgi:tetratricopeptide (TPR) repeat protein